MKQSKFSLADLLILIGALVYGFIFYLSKNFLTMGDTIQSIIWAVIVAVTLGGLALGAKLLKRTNGNFKISLIFELIFLISFIVTAVILMKPFSHFIEVTSQKTEIKNQITQNIAQAENMFVEYEGYVDDREYLYGQFLRSVVNGKSINKDEYLEYGFVDDVDDQEQIKNKLFLLNAKLKPSNYNNIKTIATDWMMASKNIINKWNAISIVNVVNNTEMNIDSWQEQLVSLSNEKVSGDEEEKPIFEFPLSYSSLAVYFTESKPLSILSIVIAVVLNLMMLVSYFASKRGTRWPGLKVLFGAGGKDDNEL